jgi:bacillithiol synthase
MKPFLRPRSLAGSKLVQDYLQERPEALRFYGRSPFRLQDFRSKLERVDARFTLERRQVAARVVTPSSSAAAARLARYVEEGGAMVTTGQQAGFLTGPLYTICKALAAVALARHLERELGVLVLPVFWVASEDHDWAEVNHAVVLDRKRRPHRFELQSEDRRPLPMSDRVLEGELDRICDEIAQATGVEEVNRTQVNRILDAYRSGGSVAGAFETALRNLLSEFDILFVDAANPELKNASLPTLREALLNAEAHEDLLRTRSRAVQESGYGAQVAVLEGATNVFHQSEFGRHRLYRRGEDFLIRERRQVIARSDVLDELEREPRRFSPNVFLRPVVESQIFPTLAYVGGPGELAYFAQLSALFPAYGIESPVPVPRFSADVVEPGTQRLLEALDLELEELAQPRDVLIDRVARREMPGGVGEALDRVRQEALSGFERLIREADAFQPGLSPTLGASRNRVLAELQRAERKIVRALKRGDRESLQQLERLLETLRPSGIPQDRVLNVLSFLGRYGPHFLREVEREIQRSWRLPCEG